MKRSFRLRRRTPSLETELKRQRPEPRSDFVHSLASRVEEAGRPAPRPRRRLALAGAIAAGALVAMASVGGFGYAATAARQAASAVGSLIANSGPGDAVGVTLNASGDQYAPDYTWGDPSHNHAGDPGLTRKGGELAPPLVASCDGETALVKTTVVLDEQAELEISVVGPDDEKLLLDPKASEAGGLASDDDATTISYRVLVPRALKIALKIPCSLLEQGETYVLTLVATDPDGGTTTLEIPFRALVLTS
jgi:hypothetical protein